MNTFNEHDVVRDITGRFGDKPQTAPEVSLGAGEATERDDEVAIAILAEHLELDSDDIELRDYDHHGLRVLHAEGAEYALAMNEDEATVAAERKMREDLWEVSAQHYAGTTGLPVEAIEAIQNSMYESASEPLAKILDALHDGGSDGFIKDVVEDDGRGPTLAGYDGEERELRAGDALIYAYKN